MCWRSMTEAANRHVEMMVARRVSAEMPVCSLTVFNFWTADRAGHDIAIVFKACVWPPPPRAPETLSYIAPDTADEARLLNKLRRC